MTEHLEGHLGRLPKADTKSRAIVEQMRDDEKQHSDMAGNAGASELPLPVKQLMMLHAKVMTSLAFYF